MTAFFACPANEPTPLELAPRLASWMGRGHPDQVRLADYLDHAEAAVADQINSIDGPLALRLDVGLPQGVELLKHHDLDNYLFPLATRLGPRRFASAWATKRPAAPSLIRVDRAEPLTERAGEVYRVRTTRSADTAAWKEEVRDQLLNAELLPESPVELQLAYGVGPSRNWANLWKPTIDALDLLLGSDGRRWNPRDGRIVRLGLHQEVDLALGHAVEIEIAARPLAQGVPDGGW